jgi:hypothetical protein
MNSVLLRLISCFPVPYIVHDNGFVFIINLIYYSVISNSQSVKVFLTHKLLRVARKRICAEFLYPLNNPLNVNRIYVLEIFVYGIS